MSLSATRLIETACSGEPAVWVRVESVRGSAPREPGASMLVSDRALEGTIGGGHLEFEAIAYARRMLATGERLAMRDIVLGASTGQCCGGSVVLSLRRIDQRERAWLDALAALDEKGGTRWLLTRPASDEAPHSQVLDRLPPVSPLDVQTVSMLVSRIDVSLWSVWLFGAGHVGEAVTRVLATLPLRLTWVDSRSDRFPSDLPAHVTVLESDSPAHEVPAIPPGADTLVMTHSHALDFDLCRALLARADLGCIGLIGSSTKAASFRARLTRRGLTPEQIGRLRCPIGEPPRGDASRHVLDRHPGAIAVSVAHQLWSLRRTRCVLDAEPQTLQAADALDASDAPDASHRAARAQG